MNNIVYVTYAETSYDNSRYYISNTNPVIWNRDINYAKKYSASKSAEYEVVADYYNYRYIKNLIDNNTISKIYIGEYNTINGVELRRLNIL